MDYGALFQRLYDRQPVGFDEGVLAREEDRLGFVLPPPLRSLYLTCGREECVMGSHSRFLAQAALGVADGRLVFCEENQGVCVWGCVAGDEDPAAEVGNVLRDGALEWHSEEMSLSRFLEIMVYLQTAWGGSTTPAVSREPTSRCPRSKRSGTRSSGTTG